MLMVGLHMHYWCKLQLQLGSRDMQRSYTVSAVWVHAPTVEQQLKKSQVALPRSPKHGISQGCFLLQGKYTQQALTLNHHYSITHTDSRAQPTQAKTIKCHLNKQRF